MNRDLALGITTLALAAGYYLLTAQIPESQLADAVGPQGLPRIYAYVLGGLSLVLIATSRRSQSPESPEPRAESPEPKAQSPESRAERPAPSAKSPKPSARSQVLRALGVIAIGAVYLVVVPWLGYVVSLAALIGVTTYYQGGGANRRVAIVSISGALLFWLLFVAILGIPHPPGLWPSLF